MATMLSITSGLFCLRPITWGLGKIIKNPRVLGIILEFFYLGLSIIYAIIFWASLFSLGEDLSFNEVGACIALLLVGLFGTFGVGFGILHYHKSDDEMTEDRSDGYDITIDYDASSHTAKGTATERIKTELTIDALLAVALSPFNPLIRLFNLIYSFRILFNHQYVCDLAIGAHPETHGLFRTICIDTVHVNDYK